MNLRPVFIIAAALLLTAAQADKPVTADGSVISLTVGPDGRATYKQDYHQDQKTNEQTAFAPLTAFAVEGQVTWRDRPWQDLAFNASRVIYKITLNKPVANLLLGFSFWGTKDTEGIVWASPDGRQWTRLWAYDPKTMATDTHVTQAVDLPPCQSKTAPVVYLKLGTDTKWGLLFGWSLKAFETVPPTPQAYRPGPVPPDGALRYCIHYGDVDPDLLDFLQQARANFLHWHGPFSGYTGLPERSKLEGLKRAAKSTIDQVHAAGMACILYIGPCFSYGDVVKRDRLFGFYDNIWQQYEDYFGKRPGDLLDMAQRDVEGKPRPYVYEGDEGYHLCVNSPGVRQYTKGLMRMIVEAGGDGSFYDGPYVAEGRCYCKWCQEKFRQWLRDTYSAADLEKHFGVTDLGTVQPPKSAKERLWVPFRRFNAWSLYDFMRDTKTYARSLNPNYLMTSNYCMWEGEPFGPIRGTAEDAELESKIIDVLFDEAKYGAGPHWEKSGKVSNATDCRYLLAAAQGLPSALLKTAPEGNNPAAGANLTRLAIAEAAANGITWQFCKLKPAAAAGAVQYEAFLASRQEALVKCRPWSTVGVWTSATQAYWDAPTYPMAVSRFLADSHLPHKLVIDAEVEQGKLDGYEVLIVPEVRVISARQVAALEAFVQSGHGVILMGPCGAQDEWGDKRAKLPLGQPEAAQGVAEQALGKGRVVCCPSAPLTQSPNNGLAPAEQEKLAALPQWVDWAANRGLPAYLQGSDQVEVSTSYDGKAKLLVHLVNYGVDLNGRLTPVENLPVLVRLPQGMIASGSAQCFTAEAAKPSPLKWEDSHPGPERYVSFIVPRLDLYSQIELVLKPEPRPATELPRLLVSVQGEAAPGATVQIQAALSRSVAASWQCSQGRDWQVAEAALPEGRAFTIKVADTRPPGLLSLRVTASLRSGETLSRQVWLEVKPPFEVCLRLPAFANVVSGRTKASVEVTNRLPQPLAGQLKITPPAGWSVEGGEVPVEVKPQGTQQLTAWLKSPPKPAPGACDVLATVTAGGREAKTQAPLTVLDSLRLLLCPLVAAAPKLDGVPDDPCWQKATVAGNFQRTDGAGPAQQQTDVRLCYDAKALYVAFDCRESEPQTIIDLIGEDGGEVWRDDSVEVFVDSTLTRQNLWHWTANSAGRKTPAQWWQCAAARTATGWCVEMALPITDKVQPGDMMGLNLCRTRPARPQNQPEYSSWAPMPGGFWHPEAFGVIVFGDK